MSNERWKNDDIQFPRLLCEIAAAGLSAEQSRTICDSMDVTPDELFELFERAENRFENIKVGLKLQGKPATFNQ